MHLSEALAESGLDQAIAASNALTNGWTVLLSSSAVSCSEIARIYKLRYQHLLLRPGVHAEQLASSVEELLTGLSNNSLASGNWMTISGNAEHKFLLFVVADTSQVLGCLRIISEQQVSDERWQELWPHEI